MESAAVMDLQALPEGCIANVISLTTPRDACRMSSISQDFKSAGESDAVWDKFLPPETHTILSQSAAKSKKELYLTLCDNPVLINDGKMSFSLDKWSGKNCYMISARDLHIVWTCTPIYWRYVSLPESRFGEVAELLSVCWLEIRGKIDTRMLSPSTMYKAYLVFKLTSYAYGFKNRPAVVTVGLGGGESTKQTVLLDPDTERRWIPTGLQESELREMDEAQHPKERADGWLEVELGEFFCGGEECGELEMDCMEIKSGWGKRGLIVEGIEVRPKRISVALINVQGV